MALVFTPTVLSAVGNSSPIVPYQNALVVLGEIPVQPITNFGVMCSVSAGGVLTYSVQVTCDPPTSILNWIDHDVLVDLTDSLFSYVIFPISALRLKVTAWTSGSVSMGVVQWP